MNICGKKPILLGLHKVFHIRINHEDFTFSDSFFLLHFDISEVTFS